MASPSLVASAQRFALVTGASGGIGAELARQLAARGVHVVLVARSGDKLQALADELSVQYGIQAHPLAFDLTNPHTPAALAEECQRRGIEVDFLVNNAGFGDFGEFIHTDAHKQLDMIQVNMTALTDLTHRFLPGMVQRRRGRVLNVASTAAFMPGPLMAVYYATKAYVLSFSEALHEELCGTDVYVTALCPGPTRTGFVGEAHMEKSRLFDLTRAAILPPEEVARQGLEAMWRGDSVHVAGHANKLTTLLPRLIPRPWMPPLIRRIQARK